MKKLNDPLSIKRVLRSILLNYKVITLFIVITIITTIVYNYYEKEHKKEIFNNLNINFKEIKAIEYGTANYDPMDLVEDVPNGEIVSYTESVDTKSMGTKELTYVVKQEDVYKVIKLEAEVVDTKKPDIEISEEKISIEQGNSFNAQDNITSVVDQVDGKLEYLENDKEDNIAYYTVTTDLDTNVVGNYSVNVKAVDNNGNVTEKKFTVDVVAKPEPEKQPTLNNNTTYNANPTVDTSSVVSAAKSFLGYNYTPGGASPQTGFDCSGFTSYIYSLFGKNIGRSTSDQLYAGTSVSRANMQPGDIILWSDSGSYPTHSTLYLGNDTMIHAANSNDGVIISNVSSWERYAGHIVSIRRI